MTVELTIKRINTHPRFGPRGGVCVSSGASDHHACIYVERRHADGTELQVKRNLYKGKALMSSVPMAGGFEVGSPIMIGLRSRADAIEFKVDDGAWQMQALPFSPQPIDVLCASAVCKLHLRPGTKAAD